MTRLGVVEAIEAHYLTLILDAFHQAGVLRTLAEGSADAPELAGRLGFDPNQIEPLLAFVALRCDLLTRDNGKYQLSGGRGSVMFAEHLLDQYVGGYGPPLAKLASLLRDARSGAALVDRRRHADAFAGQSDGARSSEVLQLVLDFGATNILDLGCGGGQLLCDAAAANQDLRGFGIDSNPEAVAAARTHAQQLALDARIEIACGDALEVLAERTRADAHIQLVIASSVLNAYWSAPGSAAAFIRDLASLLPGRILIVSDYYSHLARDTQAIEARTLIHDVAQVVSGQGLPPPSFEGWRQVYDDAEAELLHRFEATGNGVDRFIHVLQLPG
ncbi:class I SAM-dependent methyltransferase [soil metagenome]